MKPCRETRRLTSLAALLCSVQRGRPEFMALGLWGLGIYGGIIGFHKSTL